MRTEQSSVAATRTATCGVCRKRVAVAIAVNYQGARANQVFNVLDELEDEHADEDPTVRAVMGR